jgi:branched-chain amino acid transport system ATP-binding protein
MLELDGVSTYYGESQVLDDISMSVEEGEVLGVLGRNGAGKTTTLRTILGLVKPRTGTVHFDGQDITDLPAHEISKRGISLVPEDRRIVPKFTVMENLRLVTDSMGGDEADVERVFELFPGLDDRRDHLGQELSGGQQQMLAIGRALIGDIRLLLLDEPLEGLAPLIVEDVKEIIDEISETGVTILLVEQDIMNALDVVDRSYVIDKGQIVHEGAAEDVRANQELLDEYLGIPDVSSSASQ